MDTLRTRELTNAGLVAMLWSVAVIGAGFMTGADLLLPLVAALGIFAAIEVFRFSRGTPLCSSGLCRMGMLAVWTALGYGTFVAGDWYMLPLGLAVVAVVLVENEGARAFVAPAE